MQWIYSKQALKFLNKVDSKTKSKIYTAIQDPPQYRKLARVNKFNSERYGIKIEHYRIIIEKADNIISIVTIDTKTNMKKLKYGYF